MASTVTTITDVQRLHARYHWPAVQLNFWIIIMLVASATNLGIFASFLTVQSQLGVGVPWYARPVYFPLNPPRINLLYSCLDGAWRRRIVEQ